MRPSAILGRMKAPEVGDRVTNLLPVVTAPRVEAREVGTVKSVTPLVPGVLDGDFTMLVEYTSGAPGGPYQLQVLEFLGSQEGHTWGRANNPLVQAYSVNPRKGYRP